jgi:hypothetical protein
MWSELRSFVSRSSDRIFVIGLLSIIVCKFWLVHTEEIFGLAAKYDSLWFLNSAKHWYWNTPYSWTAFCRPPAYPLFIAFVHALGIPLRVAIECLQMGGYVALIGALRAIRFPRWLALSVFTLLLFHPESFQRNNYVQADTFYAAVLAYLVAGIFFTLVTRRLAPAICSGIAFAILWNTREESFLLPLIFFTYAVLAFCSHFIQARGRNGSEKNIFAPVSAMFLVAALLIMTVYAANYRTFGAFRKSDTTEPGLSAAYRALLRIKPNQTQRFISISREAREIAYTISPTFAQLKPYFDSDLGGWEGHGSPNEIRTVFFIWALRQMADRAGAYGDPQTAANFYFKIAKEINAACDQKRIPCRFVLSTSIDPNATASLRYIPKSFSDICHLFMLRYKISPNREDAVLASSERSLYDEMAGRAASGTRVGTLRIVGWAFRFGDPIMIIAHDSGGGEIDSAISSFGERADVVKQFESEGEISLKNEFGLLLTVRRKGDPAGKLIFITQSGRKFIGSTQSILTGQAPTENGATNGEQLHCHIFAQELTPASGILSQSFEIVIGKYYRYLVRGLIWAGVAAAFVLVFNFQSLRLSEPGNAFLVLVASITIARVDLFTFINATAWPDIDPRFLFPVMSLNTLFLVVLIYQAAGVVSFKAALASRPEFFSSMTRKIEKSG